MAQRQLELSCERFRKVLNPEDDRTIREASLDDVRATIAQTERELASQQNLRNFERLSPYVNAIERYGKVIEVFCNSHPFVPYIWGPLKLIILAVKEQTQALDQILDAYAQIGNALPRLSALQMAYKDDHDFQTLFAFLYDDITEFHRHVYRLIRRPAWPIFFSSAWGRFERHFGGLITNISKTSDLIDKQATTHHILEVKEWRQKSLEDSNALEAKRISEQRQTVLNWLGTEAQTQKEKLDWLDARTHEGTSTWIKEHPKFRSWLQRGRGGPVLWVHGKPGSEQGKSVLVSHFVSDPKNKGLVLYFFCDYRTHAHQVTAQIYKAYLAQYISQDPDIVPYLYEEYVAKGVSPVAKVLKSALINGFKSADFVKMIVDGIDEIDADEHSRVLRELQGLAKLCGETCKILVASQDIPSIRYMLGKVPQIFLGDEKQMIEKDMQVVVNEKLTELDEGLNWALDGAQKAALQASILSNAEGMFLWVNLILTLLQEAGSIGELEKIVTTLPKNLEEIYGRLLDRIRDRCVTPRLSRVSRIFEWLLFAEGKAHIQKYDVLLGSSIHDDCMILNRKDIPFPTALDICKPLIEDGPGGTVALIHSTLPYFLTESRTGPLLSPHIGHEHIAFACVSHLIQVLRLLETELPPERKIESIGIGCLGLQRYASQNWISHLLSYLAEATHAELHSKAPLIEKLLQLTATHDALLDTVKPHIDAVDHNSMVPDPALEKLNAFPDTRDLIRRVLSFQDSFCAQQLVKGPDILAMDSDTTLFSIADSKYQAFVELLLGATTSAGLTKAELIAFKAQFGGTAFVCSVKGCFRGFASPNELKAHKTHRHRQRLRCWEEKCSNNDVGFASTGSLREHVKKVHKRETPRIPTSLKRRKKAEDHELILPGLADLDVERLSPQYKKVEDDWYVIFNPALSRLLDVDLVHTLEHDSVTCSVKFSKDGKFMATGCENCAQIYDVISGEKICVLQHGSDTVDSMYIRSVCFSPDGKYLATGADDSKVRVWDIASCNISNTFPGHESDVYSIDFSPDGRILASGGADRSVRLWSIETGIDILTLRVEDGVTSLAISADGKLIAAGSLDMTARVWNLQGDLIGQSPREHEDSIYSVAFSPNGKELVTGSLDRTVKLWELDSSGHVPAKQALKCAKTCEGHKDFVLSVAMTPDACWVLSGSKDMGLQFWDPSTGDCQLRIKGHKNSVILVSASPTGTYFATASGDMTARIWRYSDLALGY